MKKLLFAIAAVTTVALSPALAVAASSSENGAGHGEADGRKVVGQMPAMRWDDALARAYVAAFADDRRTVYVALAPRAPTPAEAAAYRAIFAPRAGG